MKTYEGVGYRSIFTWPRHYLEDSGQLHVQASFPPRKEPSVSIL
jgi:hypothetical protein